MLIETRFELVDLLLVHFPAPIGPMLDPEMVIRLNFYDRNYRPYG